MPLTEAKSSFLESLSSFGVPYRNGSPDKEIADTFPASDPASTGAPGHESPRETEEEKHPEPVAVVLAEPEQSAVPVSMGGETFDLEHGSVVIAAITSCTNTSNPSVMVAAGLLAQNAVERGLARKPWVKSSLARLQGRDRVLRQGGPDAVPRGARLPHGRLRLHDVHRDSGPLPPEISEAVEQGDLVVCSVLSGNRNFEARIHPEVKANYLASPPLVVAYALAGRLDVDLTTEPIGQDQEGNDVFLRDLWPSPEQVKETIGRAISVEMYQRTYADVFTGDEHWAALDVPEGDIFAWDPDSTYVRKPPYFDGMSQEPGTVEDVAGARCLVMVGDSVTTDHISPAGRDPPGQPGGKYLIDHGVERKDFNSYGSRRGNHEVMVRGTFANVRLRNLLVEGSEGTWTAHLPDGEEMTIFDAAMRYHEEACRSSSSPARSTAPGRRATGRPRARTSWAFARSSPRRTSASTVRT